MNHFDEVRIVQEVSKLSDEPHVWTSPRLGLDQEIHSLSFPFPHLIDVIDAICLLSVRHALLLLVPRVAGTLFSFIGKSWHLQLEKSRLKNYSQHKFHSSEILININLKFQTQKPPVTRTHSAPLRSQHLGLNITGKQNHNS